VPKAEARTNIPKSSSRCPLKFERGDNIRVKHLIEQKDFQKVKWKLMVQLFSTNN
jgi:hypothetical protein